MSGRLIYLMGASGVGKDSLLSAARAELDGGAPVVFAHRYITRPPEPTENHIHLSEAEFQLRLAHQCFALYWHSHRLHYGIGVEIDAWLAQGLTVVINGSRAYLEQARMRYPAMEAVMVRVPMEVLRARLEARGREQGEALEARLARAQQADVSAPDVYEIWNDGPLERAVDRLLGLLRAPEAALS